MPEHIRALIVILLLATSFFVFARYPASSVIGYGNFSRRRNLWFAVTLAAFLASNFWVYTLIAVPLLIYANRYEPNPPALYFLILFALPMATIPISGMGFINYFFELSHARILALLILLPAFFSLIRRSSTLPFGRTGPDKLLAVYILLTTVLYLRETSVTDTLRQTFYLFIDVFLPYFVVSRSLKDLKAFRDTLLSLVLAIMLVALFGIFESFKHWLLYQPLLSTLSLKGMLGYLTRDGMLRSVSTAGHSIALGYLMVVGIGFYLFIQRSMRQKFRRRLGMTLLIASLIAALARGPWVGAVALLLVFVATSRNAVRNLLALTFAAALAFPLIAMLPGGDRVINLIPFIGSTEKGNIEYREKLFTNSLSVIERSPWFGSVNYLGEPEMQAMRQGEGIIDIVNTYVGIALETGFIGLGLFVGFFALTLLGIFRAMRHSNRTGEEHLLGRALLATLLAIMVIISTVSSITIIPVVYWSVAGLGVAYTQMMRKRAAVDRTSLSEPHEFTLVRAESSG